eukprot:gene11716-11861_t
MSFGSALQSTNCAVSFGVIYLDDLSFDKVVDRSRDVFVRFEKASFIIKDLAAAWGDEHDAFKELAKTVGEAETPLLVAGVPISISETHPVNPKLAARYGLSGLKTNDFPRFKLFKKGTDTTQPINYSGESKPKSMMKWIVQQTGVFVGVKGQVKELDALARNFMAAAAADRKQMLLEAKAAADAIDTADKPDAKGYVEYYIKTMQRVLDKGEGYVEQEAKRLTKMSEDKAVAAAKRDTFHWRLNHASPAERPQLDNIVITTTGQQVRLKRVPSDTIDISFMGIRRTTQIFPRLFLKNG